MMVDFEMAKDKVLMGVERKSMILSDEEKKNTAYHEAATRWLRHDARRRSGAQSHHHPARHGLGLTMQLPEADKHTYTKEYLEGMLAVLMAGAARKRFSSPHHHGAGNDIERATDIARNMVCEWGMSQMGPLAYGKKEEAIFSPRNCQHRDFSEDTALQIDREVKRMSTRPTERSRPVVKPSRHPGARAWLCSNAKC